MELRDPTKRCNVILVKTRLTLYEQRFYVSGSIQNKYLVVYIIYTGLRSRVFNKVIRGSDIVKNFKISSVNK